MNRLESWSSLFKALSEPLRLRLVCLLQTEGELCVCDLVTILDVPQSMVSRHLAYLRHSGWVISRREGLWMHYRLDVSDEPMKNTILEILLKQAKEDSQIQADYQSARSRPSNCC